MHTHTGFQYRDKALCIKYHAHDTFYILYSSTCSYICSIISLKIFPGENFPLYGIYVVHIYHCKECVPACGYLGCTCAEREYAGRRA